MAKAVITIEDTPDGRVSVELFCDPPMKLRGTAFTRQDWNRMPPSQQVAVEMVERDAKQDRSAYEFASAQNADGGQIGDPFHFQFRRHPPS